MAQVKDPVCGMQLEEEDAVGSVEYKGHTYHFCSEDCKATFEEDPDDYSAED
jgi:YHS domain-containing protein